MPTPIRPLLWQLRDRPIYFLGSMHMGPEGGFELPAVALEAFDSADHVYFEIADADAPPSNGFLMRQSGTLRDDIDETLYARLEAHKGYDPGFENLRLEALTVVMGASLYPELGYTPENGLEVLLCQRLAAQKRPRLGLETREEQLSAILTTTAAEAIAGLKLNLDNPNVFLQIAKSLINGITQGDANLLDTVRQLMRQYGPVRAKAILEDREARWADRLTEPLSSELSTIVVVGALHLAESEGIVARLRQRGHIFDRVG